MNNRRDMAWHTRWPSYFLALLAVVLMAACGGESRSKKKGKRPLSNNNETTADPRKVEVVTAPKRMRPKVKPKQEYLDLAEQGLTLLAAVSKAATASAGKCPDMARRFDKIISDNRNVISSLTAARGDRAKGIELTRAGAFMQEKINAYQNGLTVAFQCAAKDKKVERQLDLMLALGKSS